MSAWCRSPKGLEMQRRGTFSVRFPSVSHHFFIFLRWAQDYHIGQRRAASGLLSPVSCPLWSCVEFENSKLNSPCEFARRIRRRIRRIPSSLPSSRSELVRSFAGHLRSKEHDVRAGRLHNYLWKVKNRVV